MASDKRESETARNRRNAKRWPRRTKRFAINVFLIFHIFAIACWAIPIPTPFTLAFREAVRPYFVWSGLFQSWDMFAPAPKSKNMYLEAIILYKDHPPDLWTFPRMELLSYRERYFKERYRKYEENLTKVEFADLWPDAARHIARMKRGGPNPPDKILLVMRWSDITPRNDNSSGRGPWDVKVFYTYDVQPEDLQ